MNYALIIFAAVLFPFCSTSGQIVATTAALMFALVAAVSNTRTYSIIAAVMALSAAMHWPMVSVAEWSVLWPAMYSCIGLMMSVLVFKYGDKHMRWNLSILSILVSVHLILSFELFFQRYFIIDYYQQIVLALVGAQLLGGCWGDGIRVLARAWGAGYSSHKRHLHHRDRSKGGL